MALGNPKITSNFITTTLNGFYIKYTDYATPVATTDYIVTPSISGTELNNKKIIMGMNIGVATSATANFDIQGSIDESNWVTIATIGTTIGTATGEYHYEVDLSNYSLPYYRLVFNYSTSPASLGTSAQLSFIYGY